MSFQTDVARAVGLLDGMDGKIRASLPKAAQVGAVIVRDAAKANAPRRSGRLAESIGDEPLERTRDGAEHAVVVRAFYGVYVEYGTSRAPARPFLRPAADGNRTKVANAMTQVVTGNDGL